MIDSKDNYTPSGSLKRSQLNIYWQLFKVFGKLRYSKVVTIVFIIVSFVLFFCLCLLPPGIETFTATNGYDYPSNRSSSFLQDYYYDYILGPDTPWVRAIAENVVKSQKVEFVNKTSDILDYVNQAERWKGFWLEYDTATGSASITQYSQYDSIYPSDAFAITNQFLKMSNIDVVWTLYQMQLPSRDYDYTLSMGGFTALMYLAGITLLVGYTVLDLVELYTDKLMVLLTISGARESTTVFSFISHDWLLLLPLSLFAGWAAQSSDQMCNCDLPYVLLFFFIFAFAKWIQLYAFTPLFKKPSWYRILFLVVLCIDTIPTSILPLTGVFTIQTSRTLVRLLMLFLPQFGCMFNFMNFEMLGHTKGHYGYSDFRGDGYIIGDSEIFLYTMLSILIYLFIYLFLLSMMPRDIGSPLIGFGNLFSPRFWRTCFRKRQSFDSFHDVNVPAITVTSIGKTYGNRVRALDDVSFSVKEGEVIILVGPNGCGKSTLINAMTGTIVADQGTLSIYGKEAPSFKSMQDCVGICFQDNIFFPTLSVIEHFELFGKMRGATKAEIHRQIAIFSSELKLRDQLFTLAKDLSGGQKRKLCIALAFIGSPPVVILDEPTAGVDASARQLIWKTLSNFKHTTSFISSHALEEAEAVASRLFLMSNGRLVFEGSAIDLRREHHTGYILKCVGEHVNTEAVLRVINEDIPEAKVSESRKDMILMPVTDEIVRSLEKLDNAKSELGLDSYTINAEALEDVILRLVSQ